MKNKVQSSVLKLYVHRTNRMREKNKNKFLVKDRVRIEVVNSEGKQQFMYADQLQEWIVRNFKYNKE